MVKINTRKQKGGLLTNESGVRTVIRNNYIPELKSADSIDNLESIHKRQNIQEFENACNINYYKCKNKGFTSGETIYNLLYQYNTAYENKKIELQEKSRSREDILTDILNTINNKTRNIRTIKVKLNNLFKEFNSANGTIKDDQLRDIRLLYPYSKIYIQDMKVFNDFKTKLEDPSIVGGKRKTRKVRKSKKTRKTRKSRKSIKSKKFRRTRRK